MRFSKKQVILASIAVFTVLSFTITLSFSQSVLDDVSEKMSAKAGPTTVKVSGESSANIPRDNARLSVNITTKPGELTTIEEQLQSQIEKITNSVNAALGEGNVKITTGYISYNPQWYGSSPDMSSVSTHIEIPVKTEIENVDKVTKIITDEGFWVNNLQIQKVPKSENESDITVSIPFGSATPGCETTDSCFVPFNKTVNAGQTLTWENNDSAAHTITSGTPSNGPDGIFDSSLIMSNTRFSFLFDSVGEYDYFCLVHPWMIGKVTVLENLQQESNPKEPEPTEYVYQASLTATIDLPPDDIDSIIPVYQEKFDAMNNALSEYQLEQNTRQGTVSFNPTYWPPSISNVFTSSTQLLIDVDNDKLETVITAIKDSGARYDGLSLGYTPGSLDAIRQDLTQKAIENARERALEIITPMHLQINGIKSIEVKSSLYTNPYGNTPIYSQGVLLRMPYYDSNQPNEASIIVDVEFEVGK